MILRGDAARIPLADRSVDLVFGSPPYVDARLYLEDGKDLCISREPEAWVAWMLYVTADALRVSRGLVLWVCSGVTRDRNYWPACEGLAWEWFKRGGDCHAYRPCYWHRYGIPGSGGDEWFRADVEYVLAFKRPGKLPWSDNTANGQAPRWAPGGEMSHRVTDGDRRNQWGRHINCQHSQRNADGSFQDAFRPSHKVMTRDRPGIHSQESTIYEPPVLANPGVLIHTTVGGNQLGSNLAHENEAPFPIDLPKWFIASHAPPGGLVLDPFSGSGTTVDAALSLGRRGIGMDLRMSQCRLARRRLRSVTPGFVFGEEVSP